jgi:hypothetical protein
MPGLDWQPTRWPDTESATHAVRGFYMLQPVTWTSEKPRWTLYYDMAEIGYYATRDEARNAAARHHAATRRTFAWERYMAAYDPPDAGERL